MMHWCLLLSRNPTRVEGVSRHLEMALAEARCYINWFPARLSVPASRGAPVGVGKNTPRVQTWVYAWMNRVGCQMFDRAPQSSTVRPANWRAPTATRVSRLLARGKGSETAEASLRICLSCRLPHYSSSSCDREQPVLRGVP